MATSKTTRASAKGTAHKPTKNSREYVKLFCSAGENKEYIAERLGISKQTLVKHYHQELDEGVGRMVFDAQKTLHAKAAAGDVNSSKFIIQTFGKKVYSGITTGTSDGDCEKCKRSDEVFARLQEAAKEHVRNLEPSAEGIYQDV